MIRSYVRKRIARWLAGPQCWGRDYRTVSHCAFAEGIGVEPVSFPSPTAVVLFTNVPIAPTASAAGVRTEYLLNNLLKSSGIVSVHVVSSSPAAAIAPSFSPHTETDKPELAVPRIHFHVLPPNKSRETQDFLAKVSVPGQRLLVLFDRFYAEEMYSFHVHKHCAPHAILVLDLQDLHSLRRHRQEWIAQQDREQRQAGGQMGLSSLPWHVIPDGTNDCLLRELASIHRSDLTLVCSSAEMHLLSQQYKVPREKLCLAPLFGSLDHEQETTLPGFAERRDFVFVGGFRHDPNVDAFRQLRRLWPRIRQHLELSVGQAPPKLHVYGAYCRDHWRHELRSSGLSDLGFILHGHYPGAVRDVLIDKRVMLSPLRFGAGIKGKHVDAWKCGLPVVTTRSGSEGMVEDDKLETFGGIVASRDDEFIQAACTLYTDEQQWTLSMSHAHDVCARQCGWELMGRELSNVVRDYHIRRDRDYTRNLLWHQSVRSTEYFSKYIEGKEATMELKP
jgi:O-antigen biosynthesis protein